MKKIQLLLLTFIIPFISIAQEKGLDQRIDEVFKPVSDFFSDIVFFQVGGYPFVIFLLVGSALFFTIYFGFPNIKYFWTSINVVRGKYDEVEKSDSDSKDGEVSHFQALATAVSGTVGNGNIAGVALAIALGGPGATFWMIVCGLLGMSTKFVECTLGVHYRDVDENGVVYGGPMYYISKGLKSKGFVTLGKVAAVLFAIFCIGGSFGGGNAAQSNQATIVLKDLFGYDSTFAGAMIGVILAFFVGIIIIGGIKRIASVTEKIVPFMALLYILACIYILGINFSFIDDAIGLIIKEAFNPTAMGVGGFIGVLMVGFKRAAFSNEAGAGSASIAHSAVKTKYSASEGLVSLLEPFIDTVVICTMTALVIIIFNSTGAFVYGGDGMGGVMIDGVMYEGAGITSKAFAEYIPYSGVFLTIAVVLFAVSTMISWSYYGLQSWKYLFGRGKVADMTYKVLFLIFVVIGAAASMNSIWAFSDAMIFAMVFPNMIGLFFLFPIVKEELNKYLEAIKS
ncbi:MAG: alanine:cation symporter family protein [Flavobacteriaceae bacterium]|jgi:alanine or glycine:cation symporter, AGCS family|nr:alanine:cation symporter family protein [Flavobacteriaceae bacterium]MBT4112909.1 alanine:cation symporter family protein [Flavobacteriaceae bacterium]MBT4246262.1 alanine:cation symporter family protein [Flavobacteriaceae bacterium]MBT4613604.1 alanine:cation symporter family protein [Flavobacteriaceae bacterium]MBT5246296.1 alanine:cation symporter family protein [Flavobacteriaceae bacterium]